MLVLYSKLPNELDRLQWERLSRRLPLDTQKKINAFRHWQDRQTQLLGKLLVVYGLNKYASVECRFEDLEKGEWGRPFLVGEWDFNLAHSRDYLVLGLVSGGRTGVDVEKIREVDLADYETALDPQIWQEIVRAKDPVRAFFCAWTRIESVLKADGRGISFPPDKISIKGSIARLEEKKWYLHDLSMISDHACSVAVDSPEEKVEIINVEFTELCR